jgi:ribosomal protein L13
MSNSRFSQPLWHLVDARNQVVGRLATQIATILRGKHKPTFTPNYDCGDYVVVINARFAKFTGDKVNQKLYTWHTGFPGGLKQKSVRKQLEDKPEEVSACFHVHLQTSSSNSPFELIGTNLMISLLFVSVY